MDNAIFENMSNKKKSKLAKLALAAGTAVLAGKHLMNKHAEHREKRAAMKSGLASTLGHAAAGGIATSSLGAGSSLGGAGVGAAGGLVNHLVNRGVAHGIARIVHGRDNIFNRHKKANLRRRATNIMDAAATGSSVLRGLAVNHASRSGAFDDE